MNATIEIEVQTKLEEYSGFYSDFFKDVYGYRPRHDLSHWTEAMFEEEFKRLDIALGEKLKEEAKAEAAAIIEFEAMVVKLIVQGAADREAAIRWLDESEQANGDREYLCFCLGLPYGFFKKE